MIIYKEIDRFYTSEHDILVGEDGDEVVLLVEGYDIPPNNRFPKNSHRDFLLQKAIELSDREYLREERQK